LWECSTCSAFHLTPHPLSQGLIKFEPVNIAHRVDEMGSRGAGVRPLLTRRLHGERYGQKPGMKHPTGQYAHASGNPAPLDPARMPGVAEWRKPKGGREKFGPAGVTLDERRKSPIVEISVLLVGLGFAPSCPSSSSGASFVCF